MGVGLQAVSSSHSVHTSVWSIHKFFKEILGNILTFVWLWMGNWLSTKWLLHGSDQKSYVILQINQKLGSKMTYYVAWVLGKLCKCGPFNNKTWKSCVSLALGFCFGSFMVWSCLLFSFLSCQTTLKCKDNEWLFGLVHVTLVDLSLVVSKPEKSWHGFSSRFLLVAAVPDGKHQDYFTFTF